MLRQPVNVCFGEAATQRAELTRTAAKGRSCPVACQNIGTFAVAANSGKVGIADLVDVKLRRASSGVRFYLSSKAKALGWSIYRGRPWFESHLYISRMYFSAMMISRMVDWTCDW